MRKDTHLRRPLTAAAMRVMTPTRRRMRKQLVSTDVFLYQADAAEKTEHRDRKVPLTRAGRLRRMITRNTVRVPVTTEKWCLACDVYGCTSADAHLYADCECGHEKVSPVLGDGGKSLVQGYQIQRQLTYFERERAMKMLKDRRECEVKSGGGPGIPGTPNTQRARLEELHKLRVTAFEHEHLKEAHEKLKTKFREYQLQDELQQGRFERGQELREELQRENEFLKKQNAVLKEDRISYQALAKVQKELNAMKANLDELVGQERAEVQKIQQIIDAREEDLREARLESEQVKETLEFLREQHKELEEEFEKMQERHGEKPQEKKERETRDVGRPQVRDGSRRRIR